MELISLSIFESQELVIELRDNSATKISIKNK